jgi:hypothetical protein
MISCDGGLRILSPTFGREVTSISSEDPDPICTKTQDSEPRMTVSEEITCLDFRGRTWGNRRRNHMVTARGRLRRFYQIRVVVLLVALELAKSGSHTTRQELQGDTNGKHHCAVHARVRCVESEAVRVHGG